MPVHLCMDGNPKKDGSTPYLLDGKRIHLIEKVFTFCHEKFSNKGVRVFRFRRISEFTPENLITCQCGSCPEGSCTERAKYLHVRVCDGTSAWALCFECHRRSSWNNRLRAWMCRRHWVGPYRSRYITHWGTDAKEYWQNNPWLPSTDPRSTVCFFRFFFSHCQNMKVGTWGRCTL
jgi:hypothetical protein